MTGRLKKINRIDADNRDMKGAICYIDGQIYTDITHSQCINKYLEKNKNISLNDPYTRSLAYEDTKYDEYDVSLEDMEDIETIAKNINQLGFAHKVSDQNAIYIEQNTLQNVDINTVAKAIKEKYPEYDIIIDESQQKIAKLIKKSYISDFNRDIALVYIDGELVEGYTHAKAIDKYLQKHYNIKLNDDHFRPFTNDAKFISEEEQNFINYLDNLDRNLTEDEMNKYLELSKKMEDENLNYRDEDMEDYDNIQNNINQLAFAHIVGYDKSIYIDEETVNVDMQTVANAIKEKYPDYTIYTNGKTINDCKKVARLKKAWLSETDSDRKFAILYIDGQIYTGYTHYDCVTKYKEDNNLDPFDNDFNMAFAYMASNNNIYLSDQNPGYDLSDLSTIAHAIKTKFPDSNIYIDDNPNFDTDLNKEYQKIARLKRVAEDSSIVGPNGVLWNDNIWDTYDQSLVEDQKSNINREWDFEKETDNPEWIMQQN